MENVDTGSAIVEINAVEPLKPDLDKLVKMMEEMANAPKERMGGRQPGEICMYERKY